MEISIDNLDYFLERNGLTKKDWDKSGLKVDDLSAIHANYTQSIPHLNEAAEYFAKILQRCKQVHSVRWRVKDPEHLLEKIIRKRCSDTEKYRDIDVNNYSEIITDLVGVRVLHLFKYEWTDIHSYILDSWQPIEKVKAYIREGDEGSIIDSYKENGCNVESHPAGYRSIHYIISTQPTLKKITSEIQVRTIFEEGWSEIDHKVRYPNFSDNKLVSYFLTIFNRMAGSADEMGTFVKDLTAEISLQELRYAEVQEEHEEHLTKIESLASELSKEKTQNESMSKKLEEINSEIRKLRKNTSSSESHSRPHILTSSGLANGGSAASALATVLSSHAASTLAGYNSVAVGSLANSILDGYKSVAVGSHANSILDGYKSVAVGSHANSILAGYNSTVVGSHANSILAGYNSTVVGSKPFTTNLNSYTSPISIGPNSTGLTDSEIKTSENIDSPSDINEK